MNIWIDILREKILWTLSTNMSKDEASIVADYLLRAEMSWYTTQWLIKLTGDEPMQDIKSNWDVIIQRETKVSQLINANKKPAPYVASIWTDVAIQKAKECWMAIIWIRNTFSSNWVQWYYVKKIADNDLIWIMCSRSPSAVNGFWTTSPLFGTNPIWFWFPTQQEPLLFDMATSAITRYNLVLAKATGRNIAPWMAVDKLWNETTDPSKAMEWSIYPFDKWYKSSWLSMMIEMLTWPLVWWAWIDNTSFDKERGTIIIAIDPSILVDIEEFKKNCSDLISTVRKDTTAQEKIRLPWDRSRQRYKACVEKGEVYVDKEILGTLWYIDESSL